MKNLISSKESCYQALRGAIRSLSPQEKKIDELIENLQSLKCLKRQVKVEVDNLGTTLQEINHKNELVQIWSEKFRDNNEKDLIETGNRKSTNDKDLICEPAMENSKTLIENFVKQFMDGKVGFEQKLHDAKNLITEFLNELNYGASTENLEVDTKSRGELRKQNIDSKRNSPPEKQMKLSSDKKLFYDEEEDYDPNYNTDESSSSDNSSDNSSDSSSDSSSTESSEAAWSGVCTLKVSSEVKRKTQKNLENNEEKVIRIMVCFKIISTDKLEENFCKRNAIDASI